MVSDEPFGTSTNWSTNIAGPLMRCRYEIEVRAQCPVNPADIDCYAFTIESESVIEVEYIVAFFAENAKLKQIFQEHPPNRHPETQNVRRSAVLPVGHTASAVRPVCHAAGPNLRDPRRRRREEGHREVVAVTSSLARLPMTRRAERDTRDVFIAADHRTRRTRAHCRQDYRGRGR